MQASPYATAPQPTQPGLPQARPGEAHLAKPQPRKPQPRTAAQRAAEAKSSTSNGTVIAVVATIILVGVGVIYGGIHLISRLQENGPVLQVNLPPKPVKETPLLRSR